MPPTLNPHRMESRLTVALPAATLAALTAAGDDGDPNLIAGVELPAGEIPWTATLCMIGVESGDRRMLAPMDDMNPMAGQVADLPLPFMCNLETTYGHDGADAVGRIETVAFESDRATATGVYLDSPEGRLAAAFAAAGVVRGVSIDPDMVAVDYEATAWDEDGYPSEWREIYVSWRIRGATQTPFAAFAECLVEVTGLDTMAPAVPADMAPMPVAADGRLNIGIRRYQPETPLVNNFPAFSESFAALSAAALAAPARPPATWFSDPHLDDLTAPNYLDDGRCFGHIASFHECHIANPEGEHVCTCAPHSASLYRWFTLGGLMTDDDQTIPTGKITLGCGHADLGLDALSAAAHYDNSGWAAADIAVGEDEHGIWFAGAIRPTVTEDQLRELRCSPLSGDWRPRDGALELVAALAVPVPGFPIPRARVASGEPVSLIASAGVGGIVKAVRDANEPASRADLTAALERIAALESQARVLEPAARDAAKGRLKG